MFTIDQIENVSLILAPEVPTDVTTVKVVFEDVVISDVVESDTMDPPLFYVLSGFTSHSNDVLTLSSMDLSFYLVFFCLL